MAHLNSSPVGFAWLDDYLLGHDGMDATHREFVDFVDRLLTAGDRDLPAALEAFERHAVAHFGDEDRSMAQSEYGSAGCHVDEHAAVLKSLAEVKAALAGGRCDVVRSFAVALTRWFPEHAQIMDQGLVRWLVQLRLGGSPVAIRPRKPVTT